MTLPRSDATHDRILWLDLARPLLISGGMTLAVLTFAAAAQNKLAAAGAALIFALHVVVNGLRASNKYAGRDVSLSLLRYTTGVSAYVCAWSAAALIFAYVLAGLRWQHGWQYALAFALAAAGFVAYFRRLTKISSSADPATSSAALKNAVRLSILEVIAIVTTIAWMTLSGKFTTSRDDWLANNVFLAAGVACLSLSVILASHYYASARDPQR